VAQNIYRQYLLNYTSKISAGASEAEIACLITELVDKTFGADCYAYVYDYAKGSYVLESSISSHLGAHEKNVMSKKNPVIRYFTNKKIFQIAPGCFEKAHLKKFSLLKGGEENFMPFLEEFKKELHSFKAELVIPAFFKSKLLMVLIAGKKKSGRKYTETDKNFLSAISKDSLMAVRSIKLYKRMGQQYAANKKLFFSIISALTTVIEAKDKYTVGHTERVSYYCNQIVKYLPQSINIDAEALGIAALLHDIGKVCIPEDILNKPAKLTEDEFAIVRRHPVVGADILNNIDNFGAIVSGVKCHHERPDGKGYPSGAKAQDIPMVAAVISLADSFDAMITDRPYRKALTYETAYDEILLNSAKQFHPVVVDAFKKFYKHKFLTGKN
jgi:HD-GYP domain-containing protein (c-di-GMP phosphodiesterase class II)